MAELGDNERSGILISLFSTASAVGKTFLAVNMAAVLAEQASAYVWPTWTCSSGTAPIFSGWNRKKQFMKPRRRWTGISCPSGRRIT